MASIDNSGVNTDTLAEVIDTINADFVAEFGAGVDGIDTSAQSFTGRQNAILARQIVSVQQLLSDLVSVLNPNNAEGRILDFIGSLFREDRLAATAATIPARLFGVPGFLVGDRRVRYRRNDTVWRVPLGVTIGAAGHVRVDLVSDATGIALPDGTLIEAFQDGSDQWVIVDASPTRFFAVESTGAYSAGTDVEAAVDYRRRIALAGLSSGTGTEFGVQRAIARVAGIGALVDNNRELALNANGVPGKSTEVVVDQGTDAAVAQAIYDSFSDTTGTVGSTSAVAFRRDITGALILDAPVAVRFTRAARVLLEWEVRINPAGSEAPLPEDVVSIAQAAVVQYTNVALTIGLDAQPGEAAAAVRSALPVGSVPDGGLTVLVGVVGGPPPDIVPIVITSRQRARTDSAPQSASVVGLVAPYNLTAGDVLVMAANGGSAQSVTMLVTDFQAISAATAIEVAAVINARMTGFVAGVEDGALLIRSAATGAASSVTINTTSTAALLAALGLSLGTVVGNDGYVSVVIV